MSSIAVARYVPFLRFVLAQRQSALYGRNILAEIGLWQDIHSQLGKGDYTKKLLFYAEHTMKLIPMNIDNWDFQMGYIRSDEAGRFMALLVDKDIRGQLMEAQHGRNYFHKRNN